MLPIRHLFVQNFCIIADKEAEIQKITLPSDEIYAAAVNFIAKAAALVV